MYIERELTQELKAMANSYPVVTVIGPRQSGKSSLVKKVFPEKPCVNLENLNKRNFAISDPEAFLDEYPKGAILDEIQRAPELLSYIQERVDEQDTKGIYILSGSHQIELNQAITQSLAGRTAILKLLPLTIAELMQYDIQLSLNEYLYHGFFPRIYKDKIEPTKLYRDYVHTYIERDVRQIINVKDLLIFEKFIKICASRVGQPINTSKMGNDIGISNHTVQNWLSVLEASYLIFRLPPYFENFGKRITKSPKLYFTDPGLASYLLDLHNAEQIARDPARGALVENLVVGEFYKSLYNLGVEPPLYFFRDSNQQEVDLLFKQGSTLVPIEIKANQTFHNNFMKGIKYFQRVSKHATDGYIIYAGEHQQRVAGSLVKNFTRINQVVQDLWLPSTSLPLE